jgi:ATP/maltotriose-dependent transcriptional regulator MalT
VRERPALRILMLGMYDNNPSTIRALLSPEVDDRVRLSRREVQILSEAADALSNRQIAHRLGVTEGTVKRHLHNISAKLAASSRIDAVNKARAAGLLRISNDDAPVT